MRSVKLKNVPAQTGDPPASDKSCYSFGSLGDVLKHMMALSTFHYCTLRKSLIKNMINPSKWIITLQAERTFLVMLFELHSDGESESVRVFIPQPCPTLCNPMDYSPPGSSVQWISQARILEWVAIPFSRGSSWPRDQSWISCIRSPPL